MKKYKGISKILVGVLFIGLIIAIYFIFKNDNKDLVYDDFTILEGGKMTLLDYDDSIVYRGYEKGDKAYYITGDLRNDNKEQDYDYLVISFNLYDIDNNLLGVSSGMIRDLKKGDTKNFKVLLTMSMGDAEKVHHYDIKEIKKI